MRHIDIAGHLKAHAWLALQSNSGIVGVGALANDDGGPRPQTKLFEQHAREHAPPHNHDHCNEPHQQPPQARRVPTRGGNQGHVEQGQAAGKSEDVTQFVPERAAIAVVLEPHEKQHEAQKHQAGPCHIALHILC